MLQEFKDFINKGNVMDLAVGIIIGAAFTAIVGSLVEDILMPIIGMVFGNIDFSQMAAGTITYGNFITAVINFVIIAFVVFLIVRTINNMKKKQEEAAPSGPSEVDLLTEIRDALKK